MPFQIHALSGAEFAPLFAMTDAELASRRAVRVVADKPDAFPCRVSLEDAHPGETVILTNYEHQQADTPFRASHAIYVRQGVSSPSIGVDEVPEQLRRRLLSLRAFDEGGGMLAADVAPGSEVEPAIEALFAEPKVAYLHVHYAKQGCYAARIDRA